MSNLQIAFCAWIALQLPMAMIVGRFLKSSFADGQASSGETAGSVITSPRRLPSLHCHSNGCQKNQTAHAHTIANTANPIQSMRETL